MWCRNFRFGHQVFGHRLVYIYIECLFPWKQFVSMSCNNSPWVHFQCNQNNKITKNLPWCSVRDRHWFSNLVDVDVRTGDHDLDDSLAIGTLAIASDFKCFTCLREWETV